MEVRCGVPPPTLGPGVDRAAKLIPVLLNGVGVSDSDKDSVLGSCVIAVDKPPGVDCGGVDGPGGEGGGGGPGGSNSKAAAAAAFCLASAIN